MYLYDEKKIIKKYQADNSIVECLDAIIVVF